jgi:hypothetical protein
MIATTPIIIVVVLLLALVSLVVVPGAALLAIPLVLILAIALVGMALRGAAASRGGRRVEEREPGAAFGDALSPPDTRERESTVASRERTQG